MDDAVPDFMPRHPGSLLKRKLEQLSLPKAELARHLKLSRQSLYDIIAGNQCMTPSVALRVAKLTDTSAKMWLDLQQAYDLAIARVNDAELLSDVPVLNDRW